MILPESIISLPNLIELSVMYNEKVRAPAPRAVRAIAAR